MIEFWHLKNIKGQDAEIKRLARKLLSQKDSDDYKHLLNAVKWGEVMTGFNIKRIEELKKKNSSLRKKIESFLNEK